MNDERAYVNPWRLRSWSQGRMSFGGVSARSEPMRGELVRFRENNAVIDPAKLGGRRAWMESDRYVLPEPMPLEHDYAPELGFFSYWPGSPEERLERLQRATVGIAGAGTLGSQVAYMLAAAGVGHLVLCDFDTVEVRNFNRQLYDTQDLGRLKVVATAERLRRLRPAIEIDCLQREISGPGDIVDAMAGVDLIVRAMDTPMLAPFIVDEGCRHLGVPHVGGGFVETWASAGPFLDADGPCFRCLNAPPNFELPEPLKGPTFAPSAFWLSSYVSGDVLRYLGGMGEPWLRERLLTVNWATGELREERLPLQPGRCPVCGADNDLRRRQRSSVPAPVTGAGRGTNPGPVSTPAPAGPAVEPSPRPQGGAAAPAAPVPAGTALPAAVAPALIGLCAALAGLLLLREPLLVRIPCLIAAALLAGALGTALTPRRSPFSGVLWAAGWAVGAALVSVGDIVLATPALRDRPLAILPTALLAVPIDALVLTAVGALAALAVTSAARWWTARGGRVSAVRP